MGRPLIVIGPVTYAMKGRNLLARRGIGCSLERISSAPGANGCGFGLFVPRRTDEAESILRAAGIPISGRTEWKARP